MPTTRTGSRVGSTPQRRDLPVGNQDLNPGLADDRADLLRQPRADDDPRQFPETGRRPSKDPDFRCVSEGGMGVPGAMEIPLISTSSLEPPLSRAGS